MVTCGLEGIHEHGDELGPLQELRYVSYLEHDPRMRQVQACGQLLRHQAWLRIAPAEQVRLNPDWQEEMKETNFYPTSAIDDPSRRDDFGEARQSPSPYPQSEEEERVPCAS